MTVGSGFVVVQRADVLDRADSPVLATVRAPDGLHYRGLDRRAVGVAYAGEPLRARYAALVACGSIVDDLVAMLDDARALLAFAEARRPGVYELAWGRIAGGPDDVPSGFALAGYEPGFLGGSHHAPLAEWLHSRRYTPYRLGGADFERHLARLNAHGLFDSPHDADAFLAHHLALGSREDRSRYHIVEVWLDIP